MKVSGTEGEDRQIVKLWVFFAHSSVYSFSIGRVRRPCRGLKKFFPPVLQRCYGCSSWRTRDCAHRSRHVFFSFFLFLERKLPAQSKLKEQPCSPWPCERGLTIWGGSWENVHNVKIFNFWFFNDSYGGFSEEASVENRLKKYWSITKLRHFLWHAFICIFMTRHDFDRGFLHIAAAGVVYLFVWAAPFKNAR